MHHLLLNVDCAISKTSAFAERIKAIVTGHARLFDEHGTYLRVYQTEYVHLPESNQEELLQKLRLFHRKIDGIFKEAQEKQEIRPEIDTKAARYAVIGMLTQISFMQTQKIRSEMASVAESFSDILINGCA
jgi:hypothetical protein